MSPLRSCGLSSSERLAQASPQVAASLYKGESRSFMASGGLGLELAPCNSALFCWSEQVIRAIWITGVGTAPLALDVCSSKVPLQKGGWCMHEWEERMVSFCKLQGLAQIMPLFYCKIIHMWLCNMTILHSSTPYNILGEMFKLLSILCETFTYPTNHTQWCYFCGTLYFNHYTSGLLVGSEDMKVGNELFLGRDRQGDSDCKGRWKVLWQKGAHGVGTQE